MSKEEEFEEEFEEYEEYEDEEEEDEDEEGGLSGLVVLLMGVVMLGAFASVVWIAYQQGVKNGDGETPYVVADPEPVKIETAQTVSDETTRAVYDKIDGRETNPIEIIAEGPEEPLSREVADTIGVIAAGIDDAGTAGDQIVDDAVADRIAALESADQQLSDIGAGAIDNIESVGTSVVENVSDTAAEVAETVREPEIIVPEPVVTANALSGSHLVQVGAFRSSGETDVYWSRMASKVGGFLDGKSKDVERADLGAKGIYYRLRIGPFSSADAAKTYCSGLKERGQDCLIKKK